MRPAFLLPAVKAECRLPTLTLFCIHLVVILPLLGFGEWIPDGFAVPDEERGGKLVSGQAAWTFPPGAP